MRALASTTALVAAIALGALGAIAPGIAQATPSLDACTGVLHRAAGTTTPITIDAPGTWCLDQDLVESVDVVDSFFMMIAVDVGDVTLDCRGHRIQYTGAANQMVGVAVRGPELDRVTVRDCHFQGFSTALAFGPTQDFLIEDNTVRASRPDSFGGNRAIDAWGAGIVRRNRFHDSINRAITAAGASQVTDNLIDGVVDSPQSSGAFGIEISDSAGAVVRGNTVRGLVSSAPNQVFAVAILNVGADKRTVVADNVLIHDGATGPIGIYCDSGVRVSDNVIAGFFAPLVNACVDTGDNDISP
jgi:hypothetical protein